MPRSSASSGPASCPSLGLQGGFVEVSKDHVRVLANVAERCEDINIDKAGAQLAKANQDVINPALGVDLAIALEAWPGRRPGSIGRRKSKRGSRRPTPSGGSSTVAVSIDSLATEPRHCRPRKPTAGGPPSLLTICLFGS
jgi:hypothetical protein